MKYKYFYHVGEYTKDVVRVHPYSRYGMDVRSWMFTGEEKEITEEFYNMIFEDEKKIIQEIKERYNLDILYHHKPVKRLVID